MEKVPDGAVTREAHPATIHSWNTQTRSTMCGAPGQTGSTKHARDVTCPACRELLGREPRDPTVHP